MLVEVGKTNKFSEMLYIAMLIVLEFRNSKNSSRSFLLSIAEDKFRPQDPNNLRLFLNFFVIHGIPGDAAYLFEKRSYLTAPSANSEQESVLTPALESIFVEYLIVLFNGR